MEDHAGGQPGQFLVPRGQGAHLVHHGVILGAQRVAPGLDPVQKVLLEDRLLLAGFHLHVVAIDFIELGKVKRQRNPS